MTEFRSMGARLDGPVETPRGTTAGEVRKGLEGVFIRPGVLPGGASPLVYGTSTFAYLVGAAQWVTQRATGDGFFLWGNDGVVTLSTSDLGATLLAPSTGTSRIDVIYVVAHSNTENGDDDSAHTIAVAKGTASSGTPVAPAIPSGALEIGRNTMTGDATSTASDGNTITQTAPFTAARGGAIQCRTTSELVALSAYATTDHPALGLYAGRLYTVPTTGLVLPDTGATAFPFSANWGNHPSYGAAVSYKDPDGWVRLEGVAMRTGTSGSFGFASLGTLPAGHRPPAQIALPCNVVQNGTAALTPAILQIDAGGAVTLRIVASLYLTTNTSYCTLAGTFRAAG